MTSHSDNVWHLLHYIRHHIPALWHQATIFMTSHHCIWHGIHCIYVITFTVLMISHQLKFEISSAICDNIISILYDITATEYVSSHQLFNDITPFVCRTWNPLYVKYQTLYKAPHPHLIISQHIIYDITCTVFITSPSLYLKWPLQYLCHHNDSIVGLKPTVCMTSHPLYVCHRLHSKQCYIHSLWLHTIVFITLHPLHSWHHTPYIWHHTHGNRNVISAIWPTLSNTTSPVSVSSNSRYQLYDTHCIWHHTHYTCDIIFSIHAITANTYDIIPLYV